MIKLIALMWNVSLANSGVVYSSWSSEGGLEREAQ